MSTRLITFLGLGNPTLPQHYKPAVYALDGHTSPKTPMHDAATLGALAAEGEALSSLVVVGTRKVRERWFDASSGSLFMRLLGEAGCEAERVAFVEITMGETEDGRWAIFSALHRALTGERLEGCDPISGEAWCESEAPSRVVVDITHGFRSQPFFAASVMGFVQSQQRRRAARALELRILYAAYNPATPDAVVPVIELTQLLDVMAWDAAVDGLVRYGRGDDLSALLGQVQGQLMRARGRDRSAPVPTLGRLASAVRGFADDLATMRTDHIVTRSAPNLRRAVEASRDEIAQYAPPVLGALDRLAAWVEPLEADAVIGRDGLRAVVHLAKLYHATERYAELLGTLREAATTAWTLDHTPPETWLQPGQNDPEFDAWRNEQDRALGAHIHGRSDGGGVPKRSALTALCDALGQRRNDLLHGGYRAAPAKSARLKTQLNALIEDAERLFVGVEPGPQRWQA